MVPEALKNAPELFADLGTSWRIFWILNSSRDCGMVPNPIACSEIMTMLDFFEVEDEEDRIEMLMQIKALDSEMLKWLSQRQQR